VQYPAAQTAGNLNVVVVGWNDSSAQVSSVKDSKSNAYQLAVGPMTTGTLSQSIYYAKNISAATAGANTVTVTFATPATSPDVRILEYSGVDTVSALDGAAGATGNSATSSSGALTITNSKDLLVGANTVQTTTSGADSGFIQRMITNPDGDIAEDRVVTAAGSYTAGPSLTSAGSWVMQLAAFRAAGATSTSSPTPSPTPRQSSSVTLAWDANVATSNSGTNTVGYRLYMGLASANYTQSTNVGNSTTATVSGLSSGSTYYFAVTAYNAAGTQSPPSNQVSFTAP
jgi:hypothetical protein